MRYLGEQLAAAGIRVHAVRLAGHAGAPEELGAATHTHWYESVVDGFERLRAYGDPNVVIGLSLGAVLAARLAVDQREAVAGVVMLSPAFYLPFSVRSALRVMRTASRFGEHIYFRRAPGRSSNDLAREPLPRSPRIYAQLAVMAVVNVALPFYLITTAEQTTESRRYAA